MSEDAHTSGNILENSKQHHESCPIGYPRCSLCCLHFVAVNARAVKLECEIARRAGASWQDIDGVLGALIPARGCVL
jgi:hypothetical protein